MTKTQILKDPAIILGQGYITDKQVASSWECFIGTSNSTGGGSSIVKLDNAVTFEEIQNTLNIDVTAKAGIGPFEGSTSANYVRDIQEDHYSQGFYYYEQFFLPTQVWHPAGYSTDMLSTIGQGVYAQGSEEFRLTCGDSVITQIQEGVSLYVSMKLVFSSYSDKTIFQEHAGGKFGSLASVSAEVQKMVAQYDLNGNVEVTALQIGGDINLLPQIFAKSSNGYYVTSCSLQNLQACSDTVTGILDYAVNNLPKQINETNGELLSYEVGSLEFMGLNIGNSTITPQVLAAREWLGETYLNESAQLTFVDHIYTSSFFPHIFTDIADEFKVTDQNLQLNLNKLNDPENGAIQCYTSPTNCVEIANSINTTLNNINNTFINEFASGIHFSAIGSGPSCNAPCSSDFMMYPVGENYWLSLYDQPQDSAYLNIISINDSSLQSRVYVNKNFYNCPVGERLEPLAQNIYQIEITDAAEYSGCLSLMAYQACGVDGGCTGAITLTFIDNPL